MSAVSSLDGAMSGRLAIIAGGGDFPVELARRAAGSGERLFVAALEGAADPATFPQCDVVVGRALIVVRRTVQLPSIER